jgi:hypothetical protein
VLFLIFIEVFDGGTQRGAGHCDPVLIQKRN